MLPSLVLENQFGEVSNNFVVGGSSQISCNFIVDSANGNGLGIRSLKGTGVAAVYMHTSASADPGNPNPVAGYIVVKLDKNYSGYVNGTSGFVSPIATTVNVSSGLSLGGVYVITSLGTTNQANWQTLGLPAGITAAPGVAFVAITASAGTGTGTVQSVKAGASGLSHIEVVGNPNLMCDPSDDSGSSFLLVCLGSLPVGTNNSATPPIFTGTAAAPTAPADGTVIGLTFNMTPVPGPLV